MHVYLHIGVHKTGTSAIQAALTRNHLALRERGIWYYPDVGQTNHILIAQRFQRHQATAGDFVKAYIEAAQKAGLDKCIISSEVFSEPPLPMEAISAALSETDTTVIAYIRKPDEAVLAAYNELVRTDYTRWTTRVSERPAYDPRSWDPLKFWMDWNLVIAPYDRRQWTGGNIVADFLSMTGTDCNGLDLEGTANRSLPPSLIEVLRIANGTSISGEERKAFINALFEAWNRYPDMYSHGSLITEEEREAYREKMRRVLPHYEPKLRPGFDTSFLTL